MLMLHRKKSRVAKTVGIAVAMVIGAHLAAGAVLCCGLHRCNPLQKMARNAKRTVVGLVRELM